MTEADRLLFGSLNAPCDPDEWAAISRHVVQRLGAFLGHEVRAGPVKVGSSGPDRLGFNADIETASTLGGPLAISWFGFIVSANYGPNADTPTRPFIAAWLFCRSQGHRLLTREGLAYVYLTYEQLPDGRPGWINHGWRDDEFEEFEHW